MNKISIVFKDETYLDLKADEIEVTENEITLKEKKDRFRTIIFLEEIKSYIIS